MSGLAADLVVEGGYAPDYRGGKDPQRASSRILRRVKPMKTKGKMKSYAKGGMVGSFKPCPGCPSPAKCKAAGKCAMKGKGK